MRKIASVGIIGRGPMGTIMSELFLQAFPGIQIMHYSPTKNQKVNTHSLQEVVQSDLVVPCVPIYAFESVITSIAPLMHSGSVVMDICSVKVHPFQIMKQWLPSGIGFIASHPLFGPGSLHKSGSFKQMRYMIHRSRVNKIVYDSLVNGFKNLGLHMIEMTPDAHDRLTAKSQCITHYIAACLREYDFVPTCVDTFSTEALHDMLQLIKTDKITLLHDMLKYNPYSKTEMDKLSVCFQDIKLQLLT